MLADHKTLSAAVVLVASVLLLAAQESLAGVSVSGRSSVTVTTGDGGATLSNISCAKADREVTFHFTYRAWNDRKTPITQLHIMRGGRVIRTFYNRVPPRSPGHRGSTSVTVPVPYGAKYDISLCLTLAWNAEQGAAHAEQGGGYKARFARVTSN